MRSSPWGYLAAAVFAGLALVAYILFPDVSWVISGLLLAALIAVLATLAHDLGSRDRGDATILRERPSRAPNRQTASPQGGATKTTSRVEAPRPAGPAGPVPVLEKRPTDAAPQAAPIAVAGGSPNTPSKE